jgi:hypothetical protein
MDMGCDDLVDQLLASRPALERLALHGWDPVASSESPGSSAAAYERMAVGVP